MNLNLYVFDRESDGTSTKSFQTYFSNVSKQDINHINLGKPTEENHMSLRQQPGIRSGYTSSGSYSDSEQTKSLESCTYVYKCTSQREERNDCQSPGRRPHKFQVGQNESQGSRNVNQTEQPKTISHSRYAGNCLDDNSSLTNDRCPREQNDTSMHMRPEAYNYSDKLTSTETGNTYEPMEID